MNDDFRMEQSYGEQAYGESLGRYTAKTFGWMFIGLLITFGVAIGMYMTNGLYYVSQVPGWYYILFIAEIGIVIYLSALIDPLTERPAKSIFFLYATVNGIVFSMYFLIFNVLSLWMAFAITAAFFGIMALIGYFGNINFSALRPFMMAGLIFLAGFWLLAMFIDLSAYETVVCAIGIFIFLIVTAYDAKKIQAFYSYYGNVPEMAAKSSIFAALQLYLDFINLFVYLLRFVGRKK